MNWVEGDNSFLDVKECQGNNIYDALSVVYVFKILKH